jgi:rhodanese-related sulfurtransferase
MSQSLTADELARLLAGSDPPAVLDVRRRADRAASPHALPGAEWRDPEAVATWAAELAGPVVIHCVRGGSVSRSVHAALAERGVQAKFLEGGIDAWRAAGHPVKSPE